MKRIGLITLVALTPLLAMCQNSAVEKLFNKYQGSDGFTTVLVTQDAFKMVSTLESKEGEHDVKLDKIKFVKVLAQEDDELAEGLNFYDELKNDMDFSQYKELVVVKEKDQDVWVIVKDNNGRINELLVIVGGEDNVLVWMEGDFTFEELASLSELGGIEELEILDDIH